MKPIFLLIFCVLAIATYSQDSSSTSKKGIQMTGYFGVHHIQYPDLNSKLSALGYEKPLSVFLVFGLGAEYEAQSTISGIDLSILMKNSALSNASSALQLQAFLNYKLIQTNDYFIAPGLDFGLQQVKVNFKNNNSPGSFDSLFLTSGNYIRLTNLTPVAGASIIFHFRKIEQAKFKGFRLFANTRMGYKYGIQNNPWKADGNTLLNVPSDRLNSFYVQMLFDFGNAK